MTELHSLINYLISLESCRYRDKESEYLDSKIKKTLAEINKEIQKLTNEARKFMRLKEKYIYYNEMIRYFTKIANRSIPEATRTYNNLCCRSNTFYQKMQSQHKMKIQKENRNKIKEYIVKKYWDNVYNIEETDKIIRISIKKF